MYQGSVLNGEEPSVVTSDSNFWSTMTQPKKLSSPFDKRVKGHLENLRRWLGASRWAHISIRPLFTKPRTTSCCLMAVPWCMMAKTGA